MEIITLLIPIGLLLLILAIAAFRWAIKNGQYDDLDSPAHRILFDDRPTHKSHQEEEDKATRAQKESNQGKSRYGTNHEQ